MEQPADRLPAPGRLALVQEFVNSADLEEGTDQLADVATATGWLRRHHPDARHRLDEDQRRRLIDVRESLRSVLHVHNGEAVDQPASARLDGLLAGVRLRPAVTAGGGALVPVGDGVDGFLAVLTSAIVEATIAGTWERLKVCRDDECRWAFYDHSKNARGAWCTMRVCGNRAKARAYRDRQRATARR